MSEHPGTGHAEIINMLASTFDRYGWSDQALAGYLLALSDVDVGVLRRAAVEALRTHAGKMPTPAELRRLALTAVAEGVGEPPGVDEAWSEVLAAIGRHGRHGTPSWSHPLVEQTVGYLGGWVRLCNSTDQTGDRISFARCYRTLVERAERVAITAPGLAPLALVDGASHQDAPALPSPRQLPGGAA